MVRTAAEFHTTPRLVTVASDVHYWAKVKRDLINSSAILETLSDRAYCTPKSVYNSGQYMLLIIQQTYEI